MNGWVRDVLIGDSKGTRSAYANRMKRLESRGGKGIR